MIRSATVCDSQPVADLWRAAGLRFHPELTERELAQALSQDLALIAEEAGGGLTGTVFGSYAGLRGWVYRLATRPDRRGAGIATALMAELERRLLALGCPKVNLLIEADNAAVTGFYARLGYRRHELIFMEKWLVPEPGTPSVSIQNEQRHPARAPSPEPGALPDVGPGQRHPAGAACPEPGGWRDIRPELSAEPYVYAAADGLPPGITPFAAIREDEGLALVLTKADADLAGLRYGYLAARITLRVNSGLADVGLTALVSRTLAEAGLSCNVIAGLAHDHLFVRWDQAARALALLQSLLSGAAVPGERGAGRRVRGAPLRTAGIRGAGRAASRACHMAFRCHFQPAQRLPRPAARGNLFSSPPKLNAQRMISGGPAKPSGIVGYDRPSDRASCASL